MAGIKEELPVETTPSCFFSRHQFLILRLHSLSGLLPVGAYMIVHLLTNATVLAGAATFQDQVDKIHALGPALPLVEWTFIFLPLIFHAVVGVLIIRSGISNTSSYRYVNNVRYTLQRATAWIALFFIFYHVFQMHGWFHNDWWRANVAGPLHGGQFDAEHATSSAALALRSVVVQVFYVIGVLSCVFHLCNGLWTMGITWGVWTSPAAQRRATYVCAALGVAMAAISMGALVGMTRANVDEAKAVEQVRLDEKEAVLKHEEEILKKLKAKSEETEKPGLAKKQQAGAERP
jgi:succinate dehydrogenase / fumarate reductase cytochrome b subunit